MAMEDEDAEDGGLAECTVCLLPFSHEGCIPRVLGCGHSVCEPCLSAIASLGTSHTPFLRCPECSHLTRLPASGPSGLPRNIQLLRSLPPRISPLPTRPDCTHQIAPFTPCLHPIPDLSKWVLPQATIQFPDDTVRFGPVALFHNPAFQPSFPASLLPLELISCSSIPKGMMHLSYTERALYLLQFLPEKAVRELLVLLRIGSLCRRVSPVFGLWMGLKGDLFLVFRKHENRSLEFLWQNLKDGNCDGAESEAEYRLEFSQHSLKLALEVCELFMELHSEGFASALVYPNCFSFDRFGHAVLDLEAVLLRKKDLQEFIRMVNSEADISSTDPQSSDVSLWRYASPELLSKLRGFHGFDDGICSHFSSKTDIWMLGCLFFDIFCARRLWSNLIFQDYFQMFVSDRQNAAIWLEERIVLTGGDCKAMAPSLRDFSRLLLSCFEHELEARPTFIQLWHALNTLTIWSDDDDEKGHSLTGKTAATSLRETSLRGMIQNACDENSHPVYWSIALGCPSDEMQVLEADSIQICPEIQESKSASDDAMEAYCLDGHLDSVTALVICGEYMLSASFDKSIAVWSLENDTIVQRLKGHGQKVMALAADRESYLCFSGDYGGEICVWRVGIEADYLAKWYDHQDWRYTGVSSLAISTNMLYSGSGDRTIKAWSRQDYSLVATMEGHKGLVSTLLVDEEVLYSGSWDGTIQLWWCNDHSSLMVLSPHLGPIRAISMLSGLIITGYDNGSLQVWKDKRCLKSVEAHAGAISAFCLDGNILYTGSWDCTIKAWQLAELQDNMSSWVVDTCSSAITSLQFHEGKLYAGLADKVIKIRNTALACE